MNIRAEQAAAHKHANAERMQKATTVRPKPKKRRLARILASLALAVGFSFALGACTTPYCFTWNYQNCVCGWNPNNPGC